MSDDTEHLTHGRDPHEFCVDDILANAARPCLIHATRNPNEVKGVRCRAHQAQWPCCICSLAMCACHRPRLPCVVCPNARLPMLYILLDWHDDAVVRSLATRPEIVFPVKMDDPTYAADRELAVQLAKYTFAKMVSLVAFYLRYYRAGASPTSVDLAIFMSSSHGQDYLQDEIPVKVEFEPSNLVESLREIMKCRGCYSTMAPDNPVFTSVSRVTNTSADYNFTIDDFIEKAWLQATLKEALATRADPANASLATRPYNNITTRQPRSNRVTGIVSNVTTKIDANCTVAELAQFDTIIAHSHQLGLYAGTLNADNPDDRPFTSDVITSHHEHPL